MTPTEIGSLSRLLSDILTRVADDISEGMSVEEALREVSGFLDKAVELVNALDT